MEKVNKMWGYVVTFVLSLITSWVMWSYGITIKIENKADKEYVDKKDTELVEKIDKKADKEQIQQIQKDVSDIRQWVFEMYKDRKK